MALNNGLPETIEVAVTTSATAYAAGDCIGGLISISNSTREENRNLYIQSATVSDADAQSASFNLIIFDENPSSTTFTDNAKLDVADADLSKIKGRILINDTLAFNDNSISTADRLALPLRLKDGRTLYAALLAVGTPTFASISGVNLSIGKVTF